MLAPPARAGAGAGADTATLARWCCLWSVLVAALGLLTAGVSAVEVITPKEIYVAFGTEGELSCKFKSKIPTSELTAISWSFQSAGSPIPVSFFYFSDRTVHHGNHPLFKDRVTWAGNIHINDASIKINNMQYIHNGTYICDVKNPPEVFSQPGEILLYVVQKEHVPRSPKPKPKPKPPKKQKPTTRVLKGVVGIAAALILGLMVVIILLVCYTKSRS